MFQKIYFFMFSSFLQNHDSKMVKIDLQKRFGEFKGNITTGELLVDGCECVNLEKKKKEIFNN